MTARRSTSRGTARRLAAAVALCLATACAGAQKPPPGDEGVWPLPPDKPRLKWVRSISGPPDVETGLWARFLRAVTGQRGENYTVNPSGVALSVDESVLYVASGPGARVIAFDLARRSVRRVANAEGHTPVHPYAVAVDGDDRIYIADQKEAVVWVYSRDNDFLLQIGRGKLSRPTGVAVDRKRRLVYVVDAGTRKKPRHVVDVFAPDGRHLRTIGGQGSQPGEFLYPTFAAVSPDGNLYVSDTMNARVQMFDPDGALITVFGSHGDTPGEFAKPMGIAFDSLGNAHVADGQLGYVQVFDGKQHLMMIYAGKANRPEFTLLPNGLAISSKNEIFVADYAANRVNEYVLFDTSPAEPAKPALPAAPLPASPAQPPPPAGG